MTDLSILMPVFNERATLRTAVDQVRAAELPVERIEIILVDDGSTDGSTEIIDELEAEGAITAVRHDRNRGKGAAVRTALQHANGTYSAIMDADLEYNPADIADLLKPLLDGTAEAAVFGVRFAVRRPGPGPIYRVRRLAGHVSEFAACGTTRRRRGGAIKLCEALPVDRG